MRVYCVDPKGVFSPTRSVGQYGLLESIMKTCSVVLTFESVDEILWCDHSNETSSAVLLHDMICFAISYKMKFKVFYC